MSTNWVGRVPPCMPYLVYLNRRNQGMTMTTATDRVIGLIPTLVATKIVLDLSDRAYRPRRKRRAYYY